MKKCTRKVGDFKIYENASSLVSLHFSTDARKKDNLRRTESVTSTWISRKSPSPF